MRRGRREEGSEREGACERGETGRIKMGGKTGKKIIGGRKIDEEREEGRDRDEGMLSVLLNCHHDVRQPVQSLQYSTVQYSTVLYCIAQFSAV